MAEIAPRVRLRVKFEEATSAAEAYSNDEREHLTAKKRTWKRVSGPRQRYERRMLERIAAINAAVEAMRVAASKL
jgi:hypothetical protein